MNKQSLPVIMAVLAVIWGSVSDNSFAAAGPYQISQCGSGESRQVNGATGLLVHLNKIPGDFNFTLSGKGEHFFSPAYAVINATPVNASEAHLLSNVLDDFFKALSKPVCAYCITTETSDGGDDGGSSGGSAGPGSSSGSVGDGTE